MAYHIEKDTGDLVIDGFETGIAPSPHKGIANLQNVNISTETGEVMCSFARTQQTMTSTSSTGTLTFLDSTHVNLDISGSNDRFKGFWITVSNSSHGGELANVNYYVLPSSGSGYQLSLYYNGAITTGYTTGLTATIVILKTMSTPVAWALEPYVSASNTFYRYYVLDSQGLVWVYDTANEVLYSSTDNVSWFLPDFDITYFSPTTAPSGIGVLNGWLLNFSGNLIFAKSTVNLGGTTSTSTTWATLIDSSGNNITTNGRANNPNPHFCLNGHQGRFYYTDGNYIGSLFPNTSLLSSVANIQSFGKYTAVGTTGTLSNLISGSIPWTANASGTTTRIPVVFFTDQAGTIPAALTVHTVYYIQYTLSAGTFQVFAALTGGAAIDIATGAAGNQYFDTFYPLGRKAGLFGSTSTVTFSPQRLNLPYSEVSTCMAEVGNNVIIGGIGNTIYPWNQIDATPSSIISLPENRTFNILTVNQMAYIFAGYRGNIYISDGSVASLVIKIPDYCAGVPGTVTSYFEPIFTWGGTMYLRGRVYFSVLDQTSTKTGNCGGVWSFIPTQNLYIGQDTGLALRLENQSSYGTYNGVSPVLIPAQTQSTISPQYWNAWYSSVSSATYGIDATNSGTSSSAKVETDLIPVGTVLRKFTPTQIEYKLAAPLSAGESVAASWRLNGTDAYTSAGTAVTESSTAVSGYFVANFQDAQWAQLQVTLSPTAGTTGSHVRLKELRIRKT